MKKYAKISLVILLLLSLVNMNTVMVFADEDVIDEKWGTPTFVYGSALSEAQIKQTKELLKIKGEVIELPVNGEDIVRLLGSGNPKANMYSSALIKGNDQSGGVTVQIVTPENITKVTQNQYSNALITAGAKDVTVTVASPVKVTGESALTGVYKAYEDKNGPLDEHAMNTAQEELSVVTDITEELKENKDFNSEDLDMAIIDIKQNLAEEIKDKGEDLTDEAVQEVVEKSLTEHGLDKLLTEEQIGSLINLSKEYVELDNLFTPEMQEQLSQLSDSVKEKTKEILGDTSEKLKDPGFWEKVGDFVVNVFSAIADFFVAIFGGDGEEVAPGPDEIKLPDNVNEISVPGNTNEIN